MADVMAESPFDDLPLELPVFDHEFIVNVADDICRTRYRPKDAIPDLHISTPAIEYSLSTENRNTLKCIAFHLNHTTTATD